MLTTANQLKLSFEVKTTESRAIFTDTKLPDNTPVGVTLDGYADYANLVYTGTTTSGKQTWTPDKQVRLSDTQGTLYAYYPYSSTTSINAIDVDMTAEDQTDWLYATPVTGICEDKAEAAVTMNHALANINVTVNKGTYLGEGNISNITLQSDGIALGGTFNAAQATPGYTAFENEGEPLSRNVTTTAGAAATDIMVVPTGTEAAVTFLLTIDGIQFTAKSADVTLEKGYSYQYTLNLSDISTYMTIGSFGVTPWGTKTGGTLELEKYDVLKKYNDYIQLDCEVTDASQAINIIYTSSGTYVSNYVQELMYSDCTTGNPKEPVEMSKDKTYTFPSNGKYVVLVKFKDMTTIPKDIFWGCKNYTNVYIPESVTTIGDCAFMSCSGLTGELVIPNSLKTIGNSAFYNCSGLTKINIPNSVKSIGKQAFWNCKGLKEVIIPNSVQSIGGMAFADCRALTEITIPESVNVIESGTFNGCVKLKNITIPNSVQTIGDNAFSDCSGIAEVNFGDGVQTIGKEAFMSCTGLKSVNIPNSVQTIGERTFGYCEGLTEVTIGSGVQTIGKVAFYQCTALGKITLLAKNAPNVDNIGNIGHNNGILYVPEGSTGYEKWMEVLGMNSWLCLHENYILQNGVYYTADGKILLGTDKSITGTLVINDNIEYVYPFAFKDCVNLENLTLPNLITSIEVGTFYGCTGLKSITVPNSVTSIRWSAFDKCTGMTEVTIGAGVQTIGDNAFYGCSKLMKITSLATTAPTITSNVFQSVKAAGTLFVPQGCSEAYASWMNTGNYYLGKYNWTIQEKTE